MRVRSHRRQTILILALLAAILLFLIWQIARLRPPGSIRLATGPAGEHEYNMAQVYQRSMAEQGVDLEIVPTSGSLETIQLLQAGEVDAGFILNAANFEVDDTGLVALAAVGHVPIWVFYRSELETDGPLTDLVDLRGRRVSFGAEQSGAYAIGKLLLGIAQIPEEDLEIVTASPEESAAMLLAGEIDAMLLISGVNAESMFQLLLAPDIEILNFELADTYARLIPFLHTAALLEGSLNVAAREPPEDKHLLTDATLLIATESFHPDLQILLLGAAEDAQDEFFDLFPSDEVFPSIDNLTLPVSGTTERFLSEGRTALQRYLPFWIALPLERFYLLVLPAMLLLYPLLRNTPTAYGAFMRRRVFVWYKRVREIELGVDGYSVEELDEIIEELERLQSELTETIRIPTGYLQTFYNLRVHIRLVLDRLEARRRVVAAADEAQDRN